MHVTTRQYFSCKHPGSARHHIEMAKQLEVEEAGAETNVHLAYVCGSLFFSIAFVDAVINEIFVDATEDYRTYLQGLSDRQVKELAEAWPGVSRAGVPRRYNTALRVLGQEEFDEDSEPFQSFDLIRRVRNNLVHWKPESASGAPELPETTSHELEQAFRDHTFDLNPFVAEGNAFFPDKLLSAGFAEWALDSCVTFTDEFFARVALTPRYRWDEAQ